MPEFPRLLIARVDLRVGVGSGMICARFGGSTAASGRVLSWLFVTPPQGKHVICSLCSSLTDQCQAV